MSSPKIIQKCRCVNCKYYEKASVKTVETHKVKDFHFCNKLNWEWNECPVSLLIEKPHSLKKCEKFIYERSNNN